MYLFLVKLKVFNFTCGLKVFSTLYNWVDCLRNFNAGPECFPFKKATVSSSFNLFKAEYDLI